MNEMHRWTVRVTGLGDEHCTAFLRRNQLRIGAPISFDHEYKETTALEHFLAAIGSEIVLGLRVRAKRKRIEIDNVEATIECTLNNPLTFLDVVGEEGDPGIRQVRLMAFISTLEESNAIETLWQDTLLKSPLVRTLRNAVQLEMNYKIVL